MKKNTRKLVLQWETVQALRALDNRHLANAGGGIEVFESGVTCPAAEAAEADVYYPVPAVATVACG